MTQRVLVDANILLSRTLRDWLYHLRLNADGMFQLHTSDAILTEVKYGLLKQHPDKAGTLLARVHEQICVLMDEVITESPDDDSFTGTDTHDRHVHSVATYSYADIILTNNKPSDISTTQQFYDIMRADEFFCLVAASSAHALRASVKGQFEFWSGRVNSRNAALDERLRAAQCEQFARLVAVELREIALTGWDEPKPLP